MEEKAKKVENKAMVR